MVLVVRDFVNSCHTNHDGEVIYNQIAQSIFDGRQIFVSFRGVSSVTSSFLNSAFIPLLNKVSFSQIKANLKIIDSNKAINDSIVRRFKQEVEAVTM
ncbi:STAS-like domain-containing protein [Cohnella nanjingensis]|uniref:STAS-like domain-containing protein n=1 Tax=Cohnella nanjingensis TaxID=1387779 RepID=A0A7X0VF67_9BACL|nr:STAS-like domain-containing protein [Cohnella nanjingensis]